MYRALTAVLFATAFILTVSASDLIVEGDGLELVRKYEIVGGDFEEIYENDEITISPAPVSEGFIPLVLKGGVYNSDTLIFLDGEMKIEKVVSGAERPGQHSRFHPIGSTGLYIDNAYHYGVPFGSSPYKKKVAYDINSTLLYELDVDGKVKPTASGDGFIVADVAYRGYGCYGIYYYDLNGSILYDYDTSTGHIVSPFDRDKDWVLAADARGINRDENPSLSRGTRVIDENGAVRFTLNPDVFCFTTDLSEHNNPFYGSANYICQIGNVYGLTKEGYWEFYDITKPKERVLEVYDGEGGKIWEYIIAGEEKGARLRVSENEELIGLISHNGVVKLFDLATGELYNEVKVNVPGAAVSLDYISDEYGLIQITSCGDSDPGHITFHVSLVDSDGSITTLSANYEKGIIAGFLDKRTGCFVAGVPSTVYVYKIK